MKAKIVSAWVVVVALGLAMAGAVGAQEVTDVAADAEARVYLPLVANSHVPVPIELYFDDFSDPGSGWFEGDTVRWTAGYVGGEYQILLKDTYDGLVVTPDLVLPADYRIEVDARQAANEESSYGIMFSMTFSGDQYEGYQVVIYPSSQEYLLEKRTMDGSWVVLIGRTYSPAIHLGMGSNHLRVDRIGTTIHFYANDTLVTAYDDGSFAGPGRDAGIRAYSYETYPVDVRFDNFGAYRAP